jgi:hypothetical protein
VRETYTMDAAVLVCKKILAAGVFGETSLYDSALLALSTDLAKFFLELRGEREN